jgi:hypothetical protein
MQRHLLPLSAVLAVLVATGLAGTEVQAGRPGRAPAAPYVWLDAGGQPLPAQTDVEVEEFLRTARIGDSQKTKHGRYGVRKLRMEKDGVAAHAACRTMAVEDRWRRFQDRDVWFFRDHFIHEPAAYALSELLGLEMVPPAVERSVRGRPASVQIWIEGVMVARERNERGIQPPDPRDYNLQLHQMRAFDNLINNIDRNMGNILIDPDWRIWLIDHSRAFIRDRKLPTPQGVRRVERRTWDRLRSVSDEELDDVLKPYLGGPERASVLERRRLLVELIEEKIALLGEDGIPFSW